MWIIFIIYFFPSSALRPRLFTPNRSVTAWPAPLLYFEDVTQCGTQSLSDIWKCSFPMTCALVCRLVGLLDDPFWLIRHHFLKGWEFTLSCCNGSLFLLWARLEKYVHFTFRRKIRTLWDARGDFECKIVYLSTGCGMMNFTILEVTSCRKKTFWTSPISLSLSLTAICLAFPRVVLFWLCNVLSLICWVTWPSPPMISCTQSK